MKRDAEQFDGELQRFSVVKECPKCGHISLSFSHGKIKCGQCGFEEKVATIK